MRSTAPSVAASKSSAGAACSSDAWPGIRAKPSGRPRASGRGRAPAPPFCPGRLQPRPLAVAQDPHPTSMVEPSPGSLTDTSPRQNIGPSELAKRHGMTTWQREAAAPRIKHRHLGRDELAGVA
jgi:hypothetical protein